MCVKIFRFKCVYFGQPVSDISEFLTAYIHKCTVKTIVSIVSCFARADNGKMRAANEFYALKMNIIVIFRDIKKSC